MSMTVEDRKVLKFISKSRSVKTRAGQTTCSKHERRGIFGPSLEDALGYIADKIDMTEARVRASYLRLKKLKHVVFVDAWLTLKRYSRIERRSRGDRLPRVKTTRQREQSEARNASMAAHPSNFINKEVEALRVALDGLPQVVCDWAEELASEPLPTAEQRADREREIVWGDQFVQAS